jgi:hypothetical protein
MAEIHKSTHVNIIFIRKNNKTHFYVIPDTYAMYEPLTSLPDFARPAQSWK